MAEADSKQKVLAGRGEGAQRLQVGLSEVAVLLQKIGSFGDPRLYALTQAAEHLSHSQQPLVPERVFMAGGESDGSAAGGADRRPARHVDQPAGRREERLPTDRRQRPRHGVAAGVHERDDAGGDGVDAAGGVGRAGRRRGGDGPGAGGGEEVIVRCDGRRHDAGGRLISSGLEASPVYRAAARKLLS